MKESKDNLPKRMVQRVKHNGKVYVTIYEQTQYGSYVNVAEYGLVQQKNASSHKDLVKYGYKPE